MSANLYVTAMEARGLARERGIMARGGYMLSLDGLMRKLAREEVYVGLLCADDGVKLYGWQPDGKVIVRSFKPGSPDALYHWRASRALREANVEKGRRMAAERAAALAAFDAEYCEECGSRPCVFQRPDYV
jgi:hypothetical protein